MLVVLSTVCFILSGIFLCVKHNIGKSKCSTLSTSSLLSPSDISENLGPTNNANKSPSDLESSSLTNSQIKFFGNKQFSNINVALNESLSVRKVFTDEDASNIPAVDPTQLSSGTIKMLQEIPVPKDKSGALKIAEDLDEQGVETDDTLFDVASLKTDPPTPTQHGYIETDFRTPIAQ